MQWQNPRLAFPRANMHAFLFENSHLLLLSWERDDTKLLFLIRDQDETGLYLDYPGATFVERVLDTVERIFFVDVEESGQEPVRYILGSYFVVGDVPYGAYYRADFTDHEVVLFRVDGEPPEQRLEVIEGAEYDLAASAFAEQHADFLAIDALNRCPE